MAFPVHSVVTRTVDSPAGFGSAWIEPVAEVVAGSYGTWRLTYEAGTRGVAVGGRIRVRTDSDTDWGVPQFLDPAGDDYLTVVTPEGVHASVQVGGPKSLVVRILGRKLESGERIATAQLFVRGPNGGRRGERRSR